MMTLICLSNYIPISLLNCSIKNVNYHMFNFFFDQHAITSLQSSFVPGDSRFTVRSMKEKPVFVQSGE